MNICKEEKKRLTSFLKDYLEANIIWPINPACTCIKPIVNICNRSFEQIAQTKHSSIFFQRLLMKYDSWY